MKIRFLKPDPRAGTVVQMDSSRGQHFVDIGAAEKVDEARTVAPAVNLRPAGAPAPLTTAIRAVAPTPAASKPVATAAKPAAEPTQSSKPAEAK